MGEPAKKPVDNDLCSGVSDFYYLHKSTVVNHFQLVFNSNRHRGLSLLRHR